MDLFEAFVNLDRLNEQDFDTDKEGIEELSDFFADDNTDDAIEIIDPNIEEDGDIADSYVGKIVIQCDTCNSLIYKDADEIVWDDASDLVNVDEECPVCKAMNGFIVIGQIQEYQKDEEEDIEDEDEIEVKDEDEVDTIEKDDEDVIEDEDEAEVKDEEEVEIKEESFKRSRRAKKLPESFIKARNVKRPIKESVNRSKYVNRHRSSKKANLTEAVVVSRDKKLVKTNKKVSARKPKITEAVNSRQYIKSLHEATSDKKVDSKSPVANVLLNHMNELRNISDVDTLKKTMKSVIKSSELSAKDQTSALHKLLAPKTTAEVMDVLNSYIVSSKDENYEHFNEKSFDKLSESYFKEVYENVDKFKTSAVSRKDNKLFIEGVLTFKSGKEKKTSFVFESFSGKNSKVRLIGENKQISPVRNSFRVSGHVKNGEFICESFRYNYSEGKNKITGVCK